MSRLYNGKTAASTPAGTYKHKEEENEMNEENKTYRVSDYDTCVFIAMKDGQITGEAKGKLPNVAAMLASVLDDNALLRMAFSLAVEAAKKEAKKNEMND